MDKMQEYYKNALLANLCTEYKAEWRNAMSDKKALFDMAVIQQSIPHMLTFAYNGIGLTKEYLKEEFQDYINGKYTAIDVDGVKGNYKTTLYVGFKGILRLSDDVSVFMWSNISSLMLNTSKAAKFYIGCKSNVTLNLDGYNSIILMLFDESTVRIGECDTTCDVTIFKYSTDAHVELSKYCLANVKTYEKELRL